MKVCISSGHGKYIRGASGAPVPPQLDEVDEAVRLSEAIADKLLKVGVDVDVFFDTTSYDQSTNLETIVDWHNAQKRDLDCSIHFNAFDGSANGCEVLYYSQKELAAAMSAALAKAGGFKDRGAKFRDDLYVLNNTDMPCVLVETCFCDNTSDSNKYNENFDAIAEALAEIISGREVHSEPERPGRPNPPPPDVTGDNRVEIKVEAEGDVSAIVNGSLVYGPETCEHVVNFTVDLVGDVVVVINGEEFHQARGMP